jgi:hypothetical protein
MCVLWHINLEFQPPSSFTPIQDMVGGGPFNLG